MTLQMKRIRRRGDIMQKVHGAAVRDDWDKVNLFWQLITTIPGATTPKPIALDTAHQCITYEYLPGLQPILRQRCVDLPSAFQQVAIVVARLHEQSANTFRKQLNVPTFPLESVGIRIEEKRRMNGRLPTGIFYGDCWHGNLFLGADHRIVLLDPIQSPWMFGPTRYLVANGAVDLATLHMSLLISYPLFQLLSLREDRLIELAHLLVDAYLAYFQAGSIKQDVLKLSRRIADTYVNTYPHRINRFVGSVKAVLTESRIRSLEEKTAWS